MLTPAQWQSYKDTINSVQGSFNQDTVTWRRYAYGFQRDGEDTPGNINYTDIDLKCLMAYNIFRTWPMTKETVGGALDGQNIVLILNKQYIRDLGYLNSNGFFALDPGQDIFFHRGIEYRSSGETEVAQASDDTLLIYIVLKREETQTGEAKY